MGSRLLKWIKWLFILAIAAITFIVGFEFALANRDVVTVNYLLDRVSIDLAWVIFIAFFAGILVALLILGIPYYLARVDLRNVREANKRLRESG